LIGAFVIKKKYETGKKRARLWTWGEQEKKNVRRTWGGRVSRTPIRTFSKPASRVSQR